MTGYRFLALSTLFCLASCEADTDIAFLASLVPEGFQVVETVSADTDFMVCTRATFLVETQGVSPADTWRPLGKLYSSSFLSCVEGDERSYWKSAVESGLVTMNVLDEGWETHYWLNETGSRLLVMLLEK